METTARTWAAGLGQAGPRAAQARADETERAARGLSEALERDDRAQILAEFDRAVVLFSRDRRWHEGLSAAREVYNTVAGWPGMDSTPYARIVAQFAHNYAIELQQARMFEAAEEFYGESLRFFEASGDLARQMIALHQLGRLHQDQGKYAEAEQAFFASLKIARRLSDTARISKNLFQLGQVAQLTGRIEQAESLYREVLGTAEQIRDDQLLVAARHQLGILAQTARNYEKARGWFELAFSGAQEGGEARAMADSLHQLGMIAHEQGDYMRADELYHASLAQLQGSDHPADAGPTLYQLAQLARARGDFASALEYGRKGLELFQARGDLPAIRRLRDLINHEEFKRAAAPPR